MNTRVLAQTKPLATSAPPVRSNLLQRKCACGGTPGPTGECEECRKKRLQRNVAQTSTLNHQHPEVPSIVHEVLRSPGQPLDPATRAFMERRFGHDFSRVRVHTDAKSAESARAVNALAYTVGQNVVFGTGRYAPGHGDGRQLIAHELAHVVQQSRADGIHGAQSNEKLGLSSTSPTVLQKQDAEKSHEERVLLLEVRDIARNCPDFDDEVKKWIFRKAAPYIESFYKTLNKVVLITSRHDWKKPSEFGELDMDIYFSRVTEESVLQAVFAAPVEEQHVKLTVRFRKYADGLHVTGELIDWLDGHAVTVRSWEGVVTTHTTWGLLSIACDKTTIRDLPEPEPPPHEFQKTKERKRMQAKLSITADNDPLEQEADHIADQMMAESAHSAVSNTPLHAEGTANESAKAVNALAYTVGRDVVLGRAKHSQPSRRAEPAFAPRRHRLLQCKCACGGTPGPTGECEECKQKQLQGKIENSKSETQNDWRVPPIVYDVLRSPGRPLDVGVQAEMEARFGYDFSRVRIHADARAAESARAVNALAYTVGSDVVFATGYYAPSSWDGRRLLAHELWHTIEQTPWLSGELHVAPAHDSSEAGATRAEKASADRSAPRARTPPRLSRQPYQGRNWTPDLITIVSQP